MSNNVVVEDHEALIMYHHHHHHPYPCPAYFVQSPSATTLTQNDAESSTFHSPARGSVHCYHHHKKVSYDESHATAPTENDGDINRLIIMNRNRGDDDEEEDDVFDYDWRKEKGWRRYWTYRNTDSWAWIWIQISWRLLVSLSVALLVFYIATKPPPPVLSLEIEGVREFKLGEGVDRSGVSTKILNCNCSINLGVLNKSKFFRLHIHPPLLHMSFSLLPFALSHGREELYAESGTTIYEMEVGVKNKAMYGAGREMEDLLESERGLPIVVGVSVRSTYRMVPSLINPKFHHNLQCLILLHNHYDTKHRTQLFNTTCRLFTS
ncbi:uncharacterized protein LOC129299349 isoform X2 [Prosopis cineraria]|uniref:uncharacterized protein LOC129299349 isoform X2 n=1 Tax=Prosopis cineraria TaxID=364024 RepID=UPI00240F52A1|nr:uncharacterized protein LOC129299349 isoform X2 [Prosopis cineraria]